MAANDLRQVWGSPTTVISISADLANGANTLTSDATQLDNTTGNFPYGRAVINIPDGFSAAPSAGSSIDLYMTDDDVDGTDDETPLPASSDILYLAKWVGAWVMDNQDVAVRKSINISLHGVQKARFYIYNATGVSFDYISTPITVKITPFSYAPT